MSRKAAAAGKETPSKFNPFLKPEHVKAGDTFRLSGWTHRKPGQFGEQIICEGTIERTGKTYDLAVRVGSQNHRALFKQMGAEEKNWRGAIVLNLDKTRDGNEYVSIGKVDSDNPPF